jgi:hypothetical protein
MRITTRLSVAAVVGMLALSASPAAAQVTNGGFETGDFTGWTVNSGFTTVEGAGYQGYSPEEGSYFAALGNVDFPGTVSQDVATSPGTAYTLSYYLASDGGTPNYFSASWDGTEIAGSILTDLGVQNYALYQFTVLGTGSDTLTFNAQNNPGYLALDNVSLSTGVPEPATWAMMLIGFGAVGVAIRRSRRGRLQAA